MRLFQPLWGNIFECDNDQKKKKPNEMRNSSEGVAEGDDAGNKEIPVKNDKGSSFYF
jgi:hypothetical protein